MSVRKKDLFLGIDIGAGAIKIALLAKEKSNKMRLLKAACYEYGASKLSPQDQLLRAANFLKEYFHTRRKLRNAKLGISVAGQSVFVRLVKIPVTAPQKLRQIILYETQQQIPFPVKDEKQGKDQDVAQCFVELGGMTG